jgi:hypothetical protein
MSVIQARFLARPVHSLANFIAKATLVARNSRKQKKLRMYEKNYSSCITRNEKNWVLRGCVEVNQEHIHHCNEVC